MPIEGFKDLPAHLEEWTYETVVNLVRKYEFEPGTFDYKSTLKAVGAKANEYIGSICRTVCSMANTDGGFILFGVQDRRVVVASPEVRIVGIPIGGDLLKEFGEKVQSVQPEVYFEAVPQVLQLPHDASKGILVIRVPKSFRRPHMYLTTGAYYRRGDGGSAVTMTHYEVKEQMMYTEDRMKKVTLLRMELAQYREVMMSLQHGGIPLPSTPYRFDISAFKVLLADVCSLLPSDLLRDLLRVPLMAGMINNRLEAVVSRRESASADGQNIYGELAEFYNFCGTCEEHLQNLFGSLF